MRIAGSLWSVPVAEQPARLADAVAAGLEVVHWDHADGVFARQGGFTSAEAASLVASGSSFESEAHLMVASPATLVDAWAEFCSLLIVPLEAADPWAALRRIETRGSRPALAVSLDTPLSEVPVSSLPVLVMAITPGNAGDAFTPAALDRVRRLAERGTHELVGVDGGVGPAQFGGLEAAEANWLVSGNSLFSAADPGAWLAECRRTVG